MLTKDPNGEAGAWELEVDGADAPVELVLAEPLAELAVLLAGEREALEDLVVDAAKVGIVPDVAFAV